MTEHRRLFQMCLAFGVMMQSLAIGLPCGGYVLVVVVLPELHTRRSPSMMAMAVGILAQVVAQLLVQLVDSIKVAGKIRLTLTKGSPD